MKINIKKGFRRIVLSCIIFSVFIAFCLFVFNGFIFDKYKFLYSSNIYKIEEPQNKISLYKFIQNYIDKNYDSFDIYCYPYKGYCNYKETKFYNNKQFEFNNNLLIFETPTKKQYFIWQIIDFIIIFLIASIIYLIYLFFEFIIIWIIKGFKE